VPVLAIAHRTPATAADCDRLAALGVSVFEVDLQFLAGVPVVSHFLSVPLVRRVRHDRWRFTLRARAAAEEDLAAVVARVPAGAAVLVDLKTTGSAAAVVELLRSAPPARWYVSTKSAADATAVAAAGYRTWLSLGERPAFAGALAGSLPAGLDAVTVRHTFLDRDAVDRLLTHVPRVMAWTVNSVRRARELEAAGVAGITSDSPDVHGFVGS
jgi:hypothetical protein